MALLAASICGASATADEPGRLIGAVEAAGYPQPPAADIRKNCHDDLMCIARFLKDRVGPGALLVPVEESVDGRSAWGKDGALGPVATRNGRTVIPVPRFDAGALEKALAAVDGKAVLDLRATVDEDLDAMRRAASLFTGTVARAFTVHWVRGRSIDWTVQAPLQGGAARKPEIWIGRNTGPVAALFAALLHAHAGAALLGERTPADAFMTAAIPVVHGWALRVPTARLEMPGVDLAAGLMPSAPIRD